MAREGSSERSYLRIAWPKASRFPSGASTSNSRCPLQSGFGIGLALGEAIQFLQRDPGPQVFGAETPTHYITMGLHPNLNKAARMATREMIEFLVSEKGLTRDEAYTFCSLAVDLRVTQLVDETKGIHATLASEYWLGQNPQGMGQ